MDTLLMVAAITFGVAGSVLMCIYWMGEEWAKYAALAFYAVMIFTLLVYGIRAIVW
jgi:hypothetical protein